MLCRRRTGRERRGTRDHRDRHHDGDGPAVRRRGHRTRGIVAVLLRRDEVGVGYERGAAEGRGGRWARRQGHDDQGHDEGREGADGAVPPYVAKLRYAEALVRARWDEMSGDNETNARMLGMIDELVGRLRRE